LGYFLPRLRLCISLDKNVLGYNLGDFFHKLIRPPCSSWRELFTWTRWAHDNEAARATKKAAKKNADDSWGQFDESAVGLFYEYNSVFCICRVFVAKPFIQ
jgi:hypothetical protein